MFKGQWWWAHCASWSVPILFSALLEKSVLLVHWDPVHEWDIRYLDLGILLFFCLVTEALSFSLWPQVMAKFHAPVIQDNPSGWGPCAVPEKFKDMPYQPFSKGDRLGKVCFLSELSPHLSEFTTVFLTVSDLSVRSLTGLEQLIKTRDTQVRDKPFIMSYI